MRIKSTPRRLTGKHPKELLLAYEQGTLTKFRVLKTIIPYRGYYTFFLTKSERYTLVTVRDYKFFGFDDLGVEYTYKSMDDDIALSIKPWKFLGSNNGEREVKEEEDDEKDEGDECEEDGGEEDEEDEGEEGDEKGEEVDGEDEEAALGRI